MTYRPHMPHSVKESVCNRQGFKCACGCGAPLLWGRTEFDHNPALMNRAFDPVAKTYTPDANAPVFIQAFTTDCHAQKTFGPGGTSRITTRGSDIGEKARERAVSATHQAHRDVMASKQCGQPRTRKNTFGRRKKP